jgi:hypothetical protein
VDQEVAKTLGELELKLAELERELTSIGRRQEHSGESAGRLVDEAIERERPVQHMPPMQHTPPMQHMSPVEQGPRVQQGPPMEQERSAEPQEPAERDWTIQFRETTYADIPAYAREVDETGRATQAGAAGAGEGFARAFQTPVQAERQSIDLAELVRFRDKLKGTMDELIDEYGRLLSLSPPSPPRSDT